MALTAILLAHNDEVVARWSKDLSTGKAMGAFALTEPDAGSDISSITTHAVAAGDHYVLNGRKTFVSNAGVADVYVVFATVEPGTGKQGIICFAVPSETPGLEFSNPQVMSAPHPLGDVTFTDCRLPAAWCLGGAGSGLQLALATLDRMRATVGAAACGLATRAFSEAIDYATTRQQFGKRLAEFQLIQEKLARMATDLAASRLLVYRAAWERDRGAERTPVESAMAKTFATETAQRIVDDAVQILGGRGVLADHPVDHLYRAVRSLRIYEGTTEIQRLLIADICCGAAREDRQRGRRTRRPIPRNPHEEAGPSS